VLSVFAFATCERRRETDEKRWNRSGAGLRIPIGAQTTPKGRTRRTVPITDTLLATLKALDTIRTGFVIRNLDGYGMTDNETKYHCYRICRAAGLPERGWHNMRHAYGTHAAMFGVNPWKLMTWMGHKRIDETMLYVHFAEAHLRPLPELILSAQRGYDDPTKGSS
jgi:integrase